MRLHKGGRRVVRLALVVPAFVTFAAAAAERVTPPTQTVVVTAPADAASSADPALPGAGAGRSIYTLQIDEWENWSALRLEDLAGLLPGTVVEPANAGLSTALKVRGFAITRLHYGTLPDIQRMHVRDPVTIERVEVLGGNAGAALGITSPGGAIRYVGKRPEPASRVRASAQAGSNGHGRITLDATGPVGSGEGGLRYRALLAVEDGRQDWADLPRRRQTGMLVVEHAYARGVFGLDLQAQFNSTPFSFGTVVTNRGVPGAPAQAANVAWDRLLVLQGGAPADRSYRQATARWDHRFDSGQLRVDLSAARVHRNETLIGYWTLVSADEVSSYYTDYEDDYEQQGGRIEWLTTLRTPLVQHDLRFGADAYKQKFLFEGDQHIGAVVVPIAAPDFSPLVDGPPERWPRYNDERLTEQSMWVADQVRVGDAAVVSGAIRRQRYSIDSDRVGSGRVRVAAAEATTWSIGVDQALASGWSLWASRAAGMEPNRGVTISGDFLPAQRSWLSEAGLRWRRGPLNTSMAVWRIDLTNLAMTDPTDRTAVIAAGSRRVNGIEWQARWLTGDVRLDAHATTLSSRHLVKTSSSLGERFVGVPDVTAGLRLEWPAGTPWFPQQGRFALALAAVGSRMGDAANTVRVPGYVRVDLAWRQPWRGHEWYAGVRNAGDIRYVAAVTAVDDVFQGARREWLAGIRLAR